MLRQSGYVIVVIALLATVCLAQLGSPCKAGPAIRVSDRDGVTEKTVSIDGPFGNLSAHIFAPDITGPVPGIAFSHSSIQYAGTRTDLLPFARAMARAGAASVMLDGTIDWRTPNDDSQRPWTEVSCGAQWLMANVNLDLDRLAIGGPIKIAGDPFCPFGLGKQPCGRSWFYINFGWAGGNDPRYTDLMKTPQGQLRMAQFPESFYLKPVRLEWLVNKTLANHETIPNLGEKAHP